MKLIKYRQGSQRASAGIPLSIHWHQTDGDITLFDEESKTYYTLVLDSVAEGIELQSRIQRAYLEKRGQDARKS